MTSKNSFLVRMKENVRRRVWIPILCTLTMLAIYPLSILARISDTLNQFNYVRSSQFYRSITNILKNIVAPNSMMLVVICVIAVICGLQGYSYLFHKTKVDMYHSQPVKKSVRFWAIYCNGILYFVIPFLIGLLLSALAMYFHRLMTPDIWKVYLVSMAYQIILYIAVYNTTILVVMVTGNYLSFALGIGAVFGLEWGIQNLIFTYCTCFFDTFASESRDQIIKPTFSVVTIFLQGIREVRTKYLGAGLSAGNLTEYMGVFVLRVAVIGLLMLVLAYLCYTVRPEESAGKTLAFGFMRPIVKLVAIVFVSLVGGWMISCMAAKNIVLSLLVIVMSAILMHCIMEVIYEGYFKAILSHWWELLIAGALACLIFVSFQWDLFGYDTKMPENGQVSSAAILFQPQYMDMMGYDSRDFLEEHMFLTDYSMLEELVAADYFHQTNRRENGKDKNNLYDEDVAYTQATVLYRLKNGKKKYRNYYIDMVARADLMQKIMETQAYKKGLFSVLQDDFWDAHEGLSMSLETRMNYNTDISRVDNEALVSALRKDLENYDFYTVSTSYQVGILHMSCPYGENGVEYPREFDSYPIYENYENVLSCLKSAGYEYALENIEDHIQKLTIERYPAWEDTDVAIGKDETYRAEYTDREMILEILKSCEDGSFGGWWKDSTRYDGAVSVFVITDSGNHIYYSLKKENTLPKEVREKLHLEN